MLTLKKIPRKKIIIYVFVIILMLGITIYMFYVNQLLSFKESLILDNLVKSTHVSTTTQNEFIDAGFVKSSSNLDLSIFSSAKFKELKDNKLIIKEKPVFGKKDPFEIE